MRLIDTHTHIYGPEFDGDIDEVMSRALEAGVVRMILPACDPESIAPMRALQKRFPHEIALAAGLHPTELADDWRPQLDAIEHELTSYRDDYVAVGEVGMDLYWDKSRLEDQKTVFEHQLRLAESLALPVIIHCREALDETLGVISRLERRPALLFHSFGGTLDDVRKIRATAPDAYFGIGGVATFKNCRVKDAFGEIGLDRMMLETDAPYLAPVPHRGHRNEPAYVALTAQFIADAMSMTSERLAEATTANAIDFFGLK